MRLSRSFALPWKLPLTTRSTENIARFERQLEGIGNASHVVAPGAKPDDVDGSVFANGFGQVLHCLVVDLLGVAGNLIGEAESSLFRGGKDGPVAFGKLFGALLNFFFTEARDREQHLAVAHSVEAFVAACNHPEHAVGENSVHIGFAKVGVHAIEPSSS